MSETNITSVAASVTPPVPPSNVTGPPRHGGTRGADLPRLSSNTEGRFGRMFRTLPRTDFSDDDLKRLAQGIEATPPAKAMVGMVAEFEEEITPETESDDEENFGIAAGYTYFGQFVDHDLTFDPVSLLQKQNDPEALVDFRTPRFDLDCVYGRGPADQPYMYTPDERKFVLGDPLKSGNLQSHDLPRFNRRALIGDKRNDENVIVSQLQIGFLKFHNYLADIRPQLSFDEIVRLVRWSYQWCVIHDFLPTLVGQDMVEAVLPHLKANTSIYVDKPQLIFYHFDEDPFIPIEFTAAAYRFGHSMVRPIYRLNEDFDVPECERTNPDEPRLPLFSAHPKFNLNGFGPLSEEFVVDWNLFFGDIPNDPNQNTRKRVQPSYKIDTSIANPLGFLPEFSKSKEGGGFESDEHGRPREDPAKGPSSLALRNLLRGKSMGLPSGQSIARAMGEVPVPDDELVVGKATWDATFGPNEDELNPKLASFGTSFYGNAPLWYYVLAEAQYEWKLRILAQGKEGDKEEANKVPMYLGRVGGRIIAETIIGLMLGDRNSYLRQDPNGTPEQWADLDPDFNILKLLTIS